MEKPSLLEQWKASKKVGAVKQSISKAPDNVAIPLSHSQQRLWFLQQLHPNSSVYNYSEKYCFSGVLQTHHLIEALRQVFKAHDILRTVYYQEGGIPYMRVKTDETIIIKKFDLTEIDDQWRSECRLEQQDISGNLEGLGLSSDIEHSTHFKVPSTTLQGSLNTAAIFFLDAHHRFDLAKPPIGLLSIVRTQKDAFEVLLTLHHIATDKWSMNLLTTQWAQYYRTLCSGLLPELQQPEIQYADFAYWQKQQPVSAEQLNYWKQKLHGEIPLLNLPTDHRRPINMTFAGRSSEFYTFSANTSNAVLSYCAAQGVTPYVFFLTVYYVFLYRYSGQSDILVGTPISNRDQKSLEETIGFFNDTLVLRTKVLASDTFAHLLDKVKTTTLEGFSNKHIAFEHLVRELKQERSRSVNPFFQVMFLYYSVAKPKPFTDDLQVDYEFYNPGVSKFDLTFDVAETNGVLSYAFEYSTELFKAVTITRFLGYIELLVNSATASPELEISKLNMRSLTEEQRLLPADQKPTDTFKQYTGIHQPIEIIAKMHPAAPAVCYKDEQLDYGTLNKRAAALATQILKYTKGDNHIVGLCMPRSTEMIVGILGILKAGCAYLPIDPKYPAARIDFMIADAEVNFVVTERSLTSYFKSNEIQRILIGETSEPGEPGKSITPSTTKTTSFPVSKLTDVAYVIYTSGSTGTPKGVPITHGNILNSTAGRFDFYPENPKAFLLLSSISFDSSKAGIFWSLCSGANLVIAEDRLEQDMHNLAHTLLRHQVSHTLLLPTLYQLLLDQVPIKEWQSLSTVIVAGEACSGTLVKSHFKKVPQLALYNEYGPTEASVWCLAHKVTKDNIETSVPLGRPTAQAQIYLLDAQMRLVPFGASGEIYVGGEGLSTGYLNRPELTKKVFIQNPFSAEKEAKLYKTGDLARYNYHGDLEFLGRSDQQIKIRGYRVELEEIERHIGALPEVQEVVVLAQNLGSSKQIAAYIISAEAIDVTSIRDRLGLLMPSYMHPSLLVQVKAFPTLPNGKIDNVALSKIKPAQQQSGVPTNGAPNSALEKQLHKIWVALLGQEQIGVNDNFFELGGDSILSIQFIAQARKAEIYLTPNQIFDNQTIASLASYIAAKEKAVEEWSYLVALRKQGANNPLFCIHAGGGHVFFYNVLTKYINPNRPIYALQASGVYAGTEMHQSIEAMATDYIKAIRTVQPEGPYNIMSYCFSVAVGYEMAVQLKAAGEQVNLMVMDTMTNPWKLNTGSRLSMRVKSFAKRFLAKPIDTLKQMVGDRVIQLQLKYRQIMAEGDDKALATLNNNLAQICAVYTWHPEQLKATLLLTDKPDAALNKEVIRSWREVALSGVQVVPITGNHIDLFAEPEVKQVAEAIDTHCL